MNRVSRSSDALKKSRYPAGRSQLANQVYMPDVDAELERGRCHQGFELALLETFLCV